MTDLVAYLVGCAIGYVILALILGTAWWRGWLD